MPSSKTPLSTSALPQAAVKSTQSVTCSSRCAIKFWGVRGSIPTPGASTARYGGNTACVEILIGNQRLIFDGGTGLRVLGEKLHCLHEPVNAHLFFTHTQWDRIQGFPFFLPAFSPQNHFKIYGATALNGASIKQRLMEQMLRPNFFVPLQEMRAKLEFFNISAGSIIQIEDVLVETISLNHGNGALGYRLNWAGRSLVYATDTNPEQLDQNLIYLAQQADVLIYDGTYADWVYPISQTALPAQMPWKTALALAKATQVGQLILFHHSPMQTDMALDELSSQLQSALPNLALAQEGMLIEL